jgi:periplasmic divalent cation tolerance protein
MADPNPAGDIVSVFVTCGSREAAEHIATTLVEERLAACVNVLPGVTSVYRWQGELTKDAEVALLAKCRASQAARVSERVIELHAYDVPCVVVHPLVGGSPTFLDWVRSQTEEPAGAEGEALPDAEPTADVPDEDWSSPSSDAAGGELPGDGPGDEPDDPIERRSEDEPAL